jgi:glycosyltransferase involved in cell wall biosynthesis
MQSRPDERRSRPDMSAPLVSVLMPAYNVEPYLADAAISVLRQTYADLELIIVDDGSTDRTGQIAEEIRLSDPQRVRVIARRNGGQSAARNSALAISRGEFLALLDGDDIWDPEFLAQQMAVFDTHPQIDLVTGNGRFLGSTRHGWPVRPFPDRRPRITLATIISDEQAVFVMTVFRRRVLDTIGGFDESLRTNEDFEYWFRAAMAGFRFARNSEPLAWYRRRHDSLSAEGPRMLAGALRVCAKMRPLLAERPERDLLDRQIAHYETELLVARTRHALAGGDMTAAATALAALQARRPSLRHAMAALLARRASGLLAALYQLRLRARRA